MFSYLGSKKNRNLIKFVFLLFVSILFIGCGGINLTLRTKLYKEEKSNKILSYGWSGKTADVSDFIRWISIEAKLWKLNDGGYFLALFEHKRYDDYLGFFIKNNKVSFKEMPAYKLEKAKRLYTYQGMSFLKRQDELEKYCSPHEVVISYDKNFYLLARLEYEATDVNCYPLPTFFWWYVSICEGENCTPSKLLNDTIDSFRVHSMDKIISGYNPKLFAIISVIRGLKKINVNIPVNKSVLCLIEKRFLRGYYSDLTYEAYEIIKKYDRYMNNCLIIGRSNDFAFIIKWLWKDKYLETKQKLDIIWWILNDLEVEPNFESVYFPQEDRKDILSALIKNDYINTIVLEGRKWQSLTNYIASLKNSKFLKIVKALNIKPKVSLNMNGNTLDVQLSIDNLKLIQTSFPYKCGKVSSNTEAVSSYKYFLMLPVVEVKTLFRIDKYKCTLSKKYKEEAELLNDILGYLKMDKEKKIKLVFTYEKKTPLKNLSKGYTSTGKFIAKALQLAFPENRGHNSNFCESWHRNCERVCKEKKPVLTSSDYTTCITHCETARRHCEGNEKSGFITFYCSAVCRGLDNKYKEKCEDACKIKAYRAWNENK